MLKIRRSLTTLLLSFITIALSGCNAVLFNPKGAVALDEKNILIISVLLMLVIVVPVIILILFFAWRYRETNDNAAYSPNWDNNILIEIICWTIPCIIILILGIITWRSSHQLDPYKPLQSNVKPITIQAISLEWRWLFIYPEYNIATINYIQFPVGVPIRFLITAEGPMNSFQIPQLGGQIYAMAGMQTKLHLIANEPGYFKGVSANFTGEGFSEMKFFARASTEKEFNQWVGAVRQSASILTMQTYNQVSKPNIDNNIQYFSAPNNTLFMNIVMKYMLPISKLCSPNNVITISNNK